MPKTPAIKDNIMKIPKKALISWFTKKIKLKTAKLMTAMPNDNKNFSAIFLKFILSYFTVFLIN